jgi:hypothetical protein
MTGASRARPRPSSSPHDLASLTHQLHGGRLFHRADLRHGVLSVAALRQITRQTTEDVEALQQGTTLGSTLVSSVLTQIGALEEYLNT